MERRSFIKQITAVIGASLLSPEAFFAENKNYQSDLWLQILDYARFSPSPHNLQPWQIKLLSSTEAELFYDPRRLIPVSDTDNKFLTITLGIFIENVSVAAAGFGLKTDFEFYGNDIDSNKKEASPFGKFKLLGEKVSVKFDKELILKRKTSRLHYQPKAIDKNVLETLTSISREFNHNSFFSSEKEIVDQVLKLNRDTLFHDLNNEPVREELKKWLRYSKEEASKAKDGLWSHCMNFPAKLMRNFFNHPSFYNHGLVKKIINRYYLKSMDGTKTIGWITGSIATPEDCINAGRMLAQQWLELTKHNVYMHPFGSVITNLNAKQQFTNTVHENDSVWFLFRLGYSNDPPKSFRLETTDLLIKS